MNNVCLMGRLTADPELKQTTNGTPVLSFSIAVNRPFKGPDGSQQADFINCVAWRHTAEFICRYFGKGQQIGIIGAIQTRVYKDKDTGKNRAAVEVIVNNAYFAGGGQTGQQSQQQAAPAQQPAAAPQYQQQGFEPPKQPKYTAAAAGNPAAAQWPDISDFSAISMDDGDLPF